MFLELVVLTIIVYYFYKYGYKIDKEKIIKYLLIALIIIVIYKYYKYMKEKRSIKDTFLSL